MKTEMSIGEKVLNSPVGAGIYTGQSERGYPQVNNITVAWLTGEDGFVFDPHEHLKEKGPE